MSKLNALGLELLDLKTAIATEYPEIVKRSLIQTVNEMLKNEVIDQETHYLLTEPVFALQDFKHFCLEKPAYCKSEEELLSLYEEKRARLEESLQRCIEQQQISVVNYLKDEQIMVVKAYRFGVAQVQKYFGIENLEDCQSLMGRKRFVERFVALRYPKIMREFVLRYGKPKGLFKLAHSSVYYDEETQDYAIELLFKIEIGTFEEVEISSFERPILKMIERCNRWFTDHLGVDGDFYASIPVNTEQSTPKPQTVEIPQTKADSNPPTQSVEKSTSAISAPPKVKKEESFFPRVQEEVSVIAETNEEKLFQLEAIEELSSEIIPFEEPLIESDFELSTDLEAINFEIDNISIDFNPDELL